MHGCYKAAKKIVLGKKAKKNRIGGGTAAAGLTTVATAGGVATIGVIGGALTFGIGVIVGLGITAVVSATAGVGGVGTAVATHHFASKYAKTEAEFRRICGDFDTFLFCI